MIEQIILIIAFLYLFITTMLDIKYRLVWDYINYSFGAIFLLLRIMLLIISGDYSSFLGMILASGITGIVGYILYKTGAWGGGDMKLLTALCIGLFLLPSDKLILELLELPFYANFLINTLFAGIIFGIIWSAYLFIKTKTYKELKIWHKIMLAMLLIPATLMFFSNPLQKLFLSLIIIFEIYYFIKIFEDKITIIKKSSKKLDEGDWIMNDLKVGKKLIKKKPTGISKEDIKIIQASKLKIIEIKDGIPFLASFFIAFLMTIMIEGNMLKIIILSI
jgi:preflagellin peptidase FlaK